MKKVDQETNKDYQLLITRLGVITILALLAFGAVKFIEKLPVKGKINDLYTDIIYVRTNDASVNKVTITYRFTIDVDKLDKQSHRMFQEDRQMYYKQLFHNPIADIIRTKAMKMNYGQPNILHNYMKMVENTIHQNLPKEISVIHLICKIEHEPRVLKLLEQRKQATKNDN